MTTRTTDERPELSATLAADDELGVEYADAVRGSLLAELDARIDRRLASRDRLTVPRAAVQVTVALGSIGLGVVFALVARDLGAFGGTVATIVAWAAILAINVIHLRAPRG